MRILLDTNILLRAVPPFDADQAAVNAALRRLHAASHRLTIVPQVLYEYWVVATRPINNNGLGMTSSAADEAVERWIEVFYLVRDEHVIFEIWRELVRDYDVKGKNAHDARLVAAMRRHEIGTLLTFNDADFKRFKDIRILTPASVLSNSFSEELS